MPFLRIEIAALAASLLGAAPAHAAPEGLACMLTEAATDTRVQLHKEMTQHFSNPAPAQLSFSEAVKAGFQATAQACGEKHGWSMAARKAAASYGPAVLALDSARPVLKDGGLEFSRIENFWFDQPLSLQNRAMTATDANTVVMQLSARNLAQDSAQMRMAAKYISLLSLMTSSRHEFEGS